MLGSEALDAYLRLAPNDLLDDLSRDDKAEFQFDPEPVSLQCVKVAPLLKASGFVQSNSEGVRAIKAGSVYFDGERVESFGEYLIRDSAVVRLGKKQKRVLLTGVLEST
jgi:hypothetical protein